MTPHLPTLAQIEAAAQVVYRKSWAGQRGGSPCAAQPADGLACRAYDSTLTCSYQFNSYSRILDEGYRPKGLNFPGTSGVQRLI
jgi:hypothetical protein